jgi:hypothetical protein
MQETHEEMAPRKGGYCVKCKKHVPVHYFAWQDGTTHQTTCNRHELEHKLDSDGLRYCKVCDEFIKLDLFPKTGAMSYICKKHKYAADVIRKHKETEESHPGRKRRLRQWKLCWMDSRKFKQLSIGMSQHEIDLEIAKIDQKETGQYAIMPIDIKKVITTENCVVVTTQKRKRLMKMAAMNDLEGYARIIVEK